MIEFAGRKYHPVLLILLCSLIVLVIMQPWNLYFLNDDFEHIPTVSEKLFVRKNFLRPVANLFLLLDKFLYDKWAPGYFLTTWLFHSSCSVSVYLLSREVLKKYVPHFPSHAALLTALFFLFYPFHAEPLFWIIARGAIIAALFAILSLYFYIRKYENRTYFILSWLLFIAALFTYESIWNVLFFYCLISFINVKKELPSAGREYRSAGIFLLTFFGYMAIRYLWLGTFTGGYPEIDSNMKNMSVLLTNFIKLVARNFTPPFYSIVFSIIFFSLSIIVYCLATVLMFRKNKTVAWLMIILSLGLITGVMTATPLGIDTHGSESERYIYYSSFFFCFFLALTTTLLQKKWQYFINISIILLCLYALSFYNANYRYTSIVTKTTLAFVRKYADYKKAYFINVPGEYKGALIFRVCLPNAIRWIAPKCKYDTALVVRKTENASGKLPFETGEKKWEELDPEKQMTELKDNNNRKIRFNRNDVVFWFTERGLYKIK